jgi:Skp family chaperone for outer membrane proteins
VKKSSGWAVLAALLSFGVLVSVVAAQGPVGAAPATPAPPSAGTRIAVLNVPEIFKKHERFKGWMEELKRDVQAAENTVREERKKIGDLEERLQEFQKGTQGYNDMSEDITKRKAELTVKVSMQGKQFQTRQAKIYYSVYQEILSAVEYFCRQHSIDIVLQIKGDTVDPDVGESVLAYIQRQVVWHDRLDITAAIVGELNRTAINSARAADERGAPGRPASPFGGNPANPQQLPPR